MSDEPLDTTDPGAPDVMTISGKIAALIAGQDSADALAALADVMSGVLALHRDERGERETLKWRYGVVQDWLNLVHALLPLKDRELDLIRAHKERPN